MSDPIAASDPDAGNPEAPDAPSDGRSARLVGAGILLSRLSGLARERAFAHFLSTSASADVFRTALRMPNVLQNLLGEGTLSASFIPVYSELLERGRKEEAGKVAGAIFALLLAVAGALALLGIALAPVLVSVFAPGFDGPKRDLTVTAVRIIFPMTGVLVLYAWSLGILNSHRRFFLSYTAPVLWNGAMIAVLIMLGGEVTQERLVIALCWGALVGGVLQFAVQLPLVLKLERSLSIRWDTRLEGVRTTARNAGPAILGRGVVQLSGYLDVFLASMLADGAIAAIGYAQTLYILPVSLFGMAVAAAELPELARQRAAASEVLQKRIQDGLRRIAFLVVPSAIAFLVIGDVLVAALFQTGDFDRDDTVFVYLVLAGYALGLLASTATRLYSSAFFALHDTRTPARLAAIRVVISGLVGAALMFQLERVEVYGQPMGAVGLSVAAGLAAWLEWRLLSRALGERIGQVGFSTRALTRMLIAAVLAGAAARGLWFVLPTMHPIFIALFVVTLFGAVYFGAAHLMGLPEASVFVRKVLRRVK